MKKLITDKTLAAFEKWYYETHCKSSIKFEDLLLWQKSEVFDWLYSQCETIQHAFAVEFFDSVGIWSHVVNDIVILDKYYFRKGCWKSNIELLLITANEIFNSKEFEQANVYFEMSDRFASQFKDIIKNSK